jgi:hypothetical protein
MLRKTLRQLRGEMGLAFFEEPPAGASGGSGGSTTPPKGEPPKADPANRVAELEAELARLKAAPPKPSEDPDLGEKARREREALDRDSGRVKRLENAIKFTMKAPEFLKQNESLLPKDVSDIFAQAEKETYSDAIEKDSAIKSEMIKSFFAVQTNVDLLTPGQKATLDEYLKLTKTGKQEKAQATYDMIFEPAFEMLKRVKRAEALGKGYGRGDSSEEAYKQKLMGISKKHHLREK